MSAYATAILESILYCALAIPASVIDSRTKKIPDTLTYTGAIALFFFILIFDFSALPNRSLAALLCVALFLALHIFSKGLGLGDVKFIALTGLLCGVTGSILALCVASASALLVWAVLALRGKAGASTRIPFAPFIAFGTIASAVVSFACP
jgi:prepilin signal peptidase PulO-like enzyme (type II secretory pathway)